MCMRLHRQGKHLDTRVADHVPAKFEAALLLQVSQWRSVSLRAAQRCYTIQAHSACTTALGVWAHVIILISQLQK